jgi:hypothetical protein
LIFMEQRNYNMARSKSNWGIFVSNDQFSPHVDP